MKKIKNLDKFYRIIDANMNRGREGLRVIEDIIRFYLDDKELTSVVKLLRHKISDTVKNNKKLLAERNSRDDAGKEFVPFLEGKNKNINGILISNFKRVEESLRVLEEISKIILPDKTSAYKKLRFAVYTIEKNVYARIQKKRKARGLPRAFLNDK